MNARRVRQVWDHAKLKSDAAALKTDHALLAKEEATASLAAHAADSKASVAAKAKQKWGKAVTREIEKLEHIDPKAAYRTPIQWALDAIDDASEFANRQFKPLVEKARAMGAVAGGCLAVLDKYEVNGRTYLEATPLLLRLQAVLKESRIELRHVEDGLTGPLLRQLAGIQKALSDEQQTLTTASQTPRAELLHARVWKDSTLLPTIDEFHREHALVASALELAANATSVTTHPGVGWQVTPPGLLAALQGGNALYRLEKLLAEPKGQWTRSFEKEFGGASMGADALQGSSATPDWVQDRPQRRRLLAATTALFTVDVGGAGAIASVEEGMRLPPNFVSGVVTALATMQLLTMAKRRFLALAPSV